jgi:ABC-type bacteriocin/lantibiotic exporter with double-glycine peptidase domain
LIEVFAVAGLFILIALNKWLNNGPTDLITIGAFMAAAYKVIPGIVKILNLNGQMHTYAYTATDLLQLQKPINEKVKSKNEKGIGSIIFNNVSFRYKDEWLLKNISLSIKSGDFLGISGISGKGKTTLLNLLLGFIKPLTGEISINKGPEDLQHYWANISYVKQQNFLINDTIKKNITLTDEATEEKKLNDIIKLTGLEELVNSDPQGINKLIMENGKNISGGQRQRIAIARALYKEAGLIILDEPFSELDDLSQECFLQHFKNLSESGKIVILITHDKKSLSFCNQTISLDESA